MKQCKGAPTCRAAIGAVSATYEPQADAETTGPVPYGLGGLAPPGRGECLVQSEHKRKAEAQQERARSKKAARSSENKALWVKPRYGTPVNVAPICSGANAVQDSRQ